MSNTLPWRTLATPSTPSDFSAPSIALPCGSRMPDFRVTVTRAFIVRLQICFPANAFNAPQVGLARLAHKSLPISGKPEIGLSRFFQQAALAGEPATFAHQP